ncbi:Heme oxygenase [Ceraceosorus bombacis]|uniref:Heme oxygenase n=1 Tax=Ceraceosorus bombacis TaxID=401625 RepID=A0A0P1BLJ2_9BASI|nr:Heme oxygenase [Ceraceosorus bombacis]
MYHPQPSTSKSQADPSVAPEAFTSDTPLSARLQQGTARAHTAIERSRGVRALMGLARGDSSDGQTLGLERSEYIAWLVGLGCVYRTLEAYLTISAPLLEPLQSMLDLPSLFRTSTLEDDVRAHLCTGAHIAAAGALYSKLEETEALDALAHPLASESPAHQQLAELLAHLPHAARSIERSRAQFPTAQHLAIMSPLHASAVLRYSERLDTLGRAATTCRSGRSTPSDEGVCLTPLDEHKTPLTAQRTGLNDTPDLLPAHAYVRYMGDLSGGQHIAKRAKALWPIEDSGAEAGFQFYRFEKPAFFEESQRAWEMSLKQDFRRAMDGGFEDLSMAEQQTMSPLLVHEASLAFDLNRAIFDALVPSSEADELADQAQLEQQMRKLAKVEVHKLPIHLRLIATHGSASGALFKLAVPSTLAIAFAFAASAGAAAS